MTTSGYVLWRTRRADEQVTPANGARALCGLTRRDPHPDFSPPDKLSPDCMYRRANAGPSRKFCDEAAVAMLRHDLRRPYGTPERGLDQRPPIGFLYIPARTRRAHPEAVAGALHARHRGAGTPCRTPPRHSNILRGAHHVTTPPPTHAAIPAPGAMSVKEQQRLRISAPTSDESLLRRNPGHQRCPGAATRDRGSSPWSP